MRQEYPDPHQPFDPARVAPLLAVAQLLASSPRSVDACFDPDDFMDLSWCRRDRPPGMRIFKHVRTRRYLNLDAGGRAYRYVPPRPDHPDRAGFYRLHQTLGDAIDHLELSSNAVDGVDGQLGA